MCFIQDRLIGYTTSHLFADETLKLNNWREPACLFRSNSFCGRYLVAFLCSKCPDVRILNGSPVISVKCGLDHGCGEIRQEPSCPGRGSGIRSAGGDRFEIERIAAEGCENPQAVLDIRIGLVELPRVLLLGFVKVHVLLVDAIIL
jgi:hypothetical protein